MITAILECFRPRALLSALGAMTGDSNAPLLISQVSQGHFKASMPDWQFRDDEPGCVCVRNLVGW